MPVSRNDPRWARITDPATATQRVGRCVCGGAGFFRIPVPVGHPLFGTDIPCICQRNESARRRAASLRRKSGIPTTAYDRYRFESFKPGLSDKPGVARRAKDLCQQYAGTRDGWLYLYGPFGTGKTHLAYAIALYALQHDVPVYAHSVPDVMAMLRDGVRNNEFHAYLDTLLEVELLVLDDLGTEYATDWAVEQLYRVVNTRLERRLPTVFTSNFSLAQSADVDTRIVSRISTGIDNTEGWTQEVPLLGKDYRPQVTR